MLIVAAAAFAAAVYFFTAKLLKADWMLSVRPCAIKELTGLYCPGCGGMRALKALLSGRIIKSIEYHPLVVYAVAFLGSFTLSNLLRYATHGRIKGIRYRDIYLYIALGLLALNFVLKNIPALQNI